MAAGRSLRRAGSTPPVDAIERAIRFPHFHLHLASKWSSARIENNQVTAETSDDSFHFDYVIAGTGYYVDPAARPEFKHFAGHIARWRDRFTAPTAVEDEVLAAYPYFGAGHELLERALGKARI